MKISFFTIVAGITTCLALLSVSSMAQTKRLPDGTVVYNDGTKRLPNVLLFIKDYQESEAIKPRIPYLTAV